MVGIRALSLALLALALLPAGVSANSTTQIIVKREAGLTPAERAEIRADAEVRFLETLPLPRTEVVAAAPGDVRDALRDLNADPDVVYAEQDRPIHASASDDPFFWYLWGLENRADVDFPQVAEVADADTDAPDAWDDSTGDGESVAVVDSGVDLDHPDLAANLLPGWDYVDDDAQPGDEDSHGTHVTGTIAAVKDNGAGVVGVAPDAEILPLRVLDEAGSGNVSDAIAAYHDAADSGIRTVNASLGGEGARQSERTAIALHDDVLFVVAAGNTSKNNDNLAAADYPCAYDLANVLCVGASGPDDRPADFSNYGATTVDLFAPGDEILSTEPNNWYGVKPGTSMATPHVAGAAALVMSIAPHLSPVQVKAVLMQSGDYKPAFASLTVTGRRLNAAAAVDLVLGNGGPFPDGDGDGVRNIDDACPTVASSRLPNGCPDSDGDGVPDGSDNCPAAANNQSDADGDRVGDVCDPAPRGHDDDRDGRPALDDACPGVFGTLANGCPPADRDGDGRIDTADACPTEHAISNDGCPIAQLTDVIPRAKKRGARRSATVTALTSRAATVRITVQRKRGRRWVRVMSKTIVTSRNRARLRVSRVKRGAHRVKVSITSSGGRGRSVTEGFRVR